MRAHQGSAPVEGVTWQGFDPADVAGRLSAIERDREVARYDVIGVPQPQLDDLALMAAQLCDVPVAAINLVQHGRQVTVAAVGIESSTCQLDDSMCNVALREQRAVQVPDASLDPRWTTSPFVNGERARFRFYAAHPLRSPRGIFIGTLAVFDDQPREHSDRLGRHLEWISSRIVDQLELRLRTRELEETVADLTRTRNELQRSNEMLGVFTGQVAHDLRGPVTAVNISLGMLHSEVKDSEQTWLVERALDSITRMDHLILEMLAFASVGGLPDVVDLDLQEVVAELEVDLAPDLAGVDLVARDLPVVRGDATQWRIVLQNLIANAVKFSRDQAQPRVRVSGRLDDDCWHLEVADNGPGVPVRDRERVFALLAQGDPTKEGLGLGLATCMRIVAAHRGAIWIEQAPEGGALVRVRVPNEPPVPASVAV